MVESGNLDNYFIVFLFYKLYILQLFIFLICKLIVSLLQSVWISQIYRTTLQSKLYFMSSLREETNMTNKYLFPFSWLVCHVNSLIHTFSQGFSLASSLANYNLQLAIYFSCTCNQISYRADSENACPSFITVQATPLLLC